MHNNRSIRFTLLAGLFMLTGCAEVRSRDSWFENSQSIDYVDSLRPPPDPLIDLFTLPYSPSTFDVAPKEMSTHR